MGCNRRTTCRACIRTNVCFFQICAADRQMGEKTICGNTFRPSAVHDGSNFRHNLHWEEREELS